MKKTIALAGCVCGAVAALGGAPDPVFDLAAILAPPLEGRVLSAQEADGIVTEEVRFFSEMDGTNRVKIFALVCYPKGAKCLPALIWNQSGMAPASPYFPLLIAKRGYVGMCIDFPQAGYRSTGGYTINSGLTLTDDPRRAPIAHGVVALIRAVSYLQSRPEADPERIGMCGSSWGGFFTTLAMGVDSRIKAGSAMFGCGHLQDGCSWLFGSGQPPDAAWLERWGRTLDPAFRLKGMTRPMAWFSGCNDHFYWLGSLLATYAEPAGPKHLALLPNWDHGLTPELDDQVFGWLDVHLKCAPPMIAVDSPRLEAKDGRPVLRWNCVSPLRRPAFAEAAISWGRPGNWKTRYWKVIPAVLGPDGVCEAELPRTEWPALAFGTVVETNGYRSSTAAVEAPAAAGAGMPDYNGCSIWGDFEASGAGYLKALGLARPALAVTNAARAGAQAIAVKGTLRVGGGLYYTAGRPHRFALSVRSESGAPAPFAATLEGMFDGKAQSWSGEVEAGPEWKELAIAFTPPDCRAPNLAVRFQADGGTVLVDDVTLCPGE